MNNTTRLRTAALLAVLAITAAACSSVAAEDTPGSTPVTEAPSQDEPVTEAPGETPSEDQPVPGNGEPEITYRPIEVEPTLPADGYVPGGGELVAVDGNRVTVGFWMGVEDCFGVQRIDVAETDTKVNIDITVSARAADQVCIEIAEARSVTVELDAPLGDRILEIGGVTLQN